MRTLAMCGASCKRRSFFYCTGAAWKSLQLLPLLSFYLYLWSRVVSGGPGPCGLGLWASRMNFACTEFCEVRLRTFNTNITQMGDALCLSAYYRDAEAGIRRAKVLASKATSVPGGGK